MLHTSVRGGPSPPAPSPSRGPQVDALRRAVKQHDDAIGVKVLLEGGKRVHTCAKRLEDWDKAEWAHEHRPPSQTAEKAALSKRLERAIAALREAGDALKESGKNKLREALDEAHLMLHQAREAPPPAPHTPPASSPPEPASPRRSSPTASR